MPNRAIPQGCIHAAAPLRGRLGAVGGGAVARQLADRFGQTQCLACAPCGGCVVGLGQIDGRRLGGDAKTPDRQRCPAMWGGVSWGQAGAAHGLAAKVTSRHPYTGYE